LLLRDYGHNPRVNFHHVYKQKRRLEENWNNGRFKSFQLPHRDHPEEAHSECVYTIQYCGKHLVSGSRDKTLRIWDLDTQRLIKRPLEGHRASVLCLQFDSSPKEDLIVSGSSDTDVILWQFSTGHMIKRLQNAHRESVLNLKFDSRFLVTCSKDKMIKIWNRKELRPGDADYPKKGVSGGGKCPSYIVDMSAIPHPGELDQYLTWKQMEPIAEYSLIMKIDSHGAAVNAVHIYKDQLVSASGDRALRVFDIHSGVCTAVCKGHTKGIACVQYDGKRIVSGSSDNSIRVFDPISQAEVACLKGHSKLVRTIQAAFGDAPGADEDLVIEARESDMAYWEAVNAGRVPPTPHRSSRRSSRRETNAGSRRPEDIMALGAKIPPGGGGTPWSRIVSGSYDETIIIWKKAADGRWVPGQTLRQADALMAAGGPLPALSDRATPRNRPGPHPHHQHHHAPAQQHVQNPPQPVPQTVGTQASSSHHVTTTAPQQTQPPPSYTPQLATLLQNHVQNAQSVNGPPPSSWSASWHALTGNTPATTPGVPPQAPAAAAQAPAGGHAAGPGMHPPNIQAHQAAHIHQQMAQLPQNHGRGETQPNARVFKLQFDARRVICCSQDPKIVGWDFANDDEDIIECAPFFGSPK
jgi:F-box and WD-40 domain protein 1/11